MGPTSRRSVVVVQILGLLAAMLGHLLAGPVLAAGVTSATFSGGAGTADVSGRLFSKTGAAVTLDVVTDAATNCVALTGAHTASTTAPTTATSTSKSWTFSLSAATGADSERTTTVTARDGSGCTGSQASVDRSYTVDNTPPTLSASVSPTANPAAWRNANVAITWSASDAGSGVGIGPTPATDSQTTNTGGTIHSATATDRVGNRGTGSVVIKLDKNAPTIIGSRNPVANGDGWNNTNVTVSFTCSDGVSGIRSCSGPTTLSSNGAGQSVTGNATDFAGNTASATVNNVRIDRNAPTISGSPVGSANVAGWYNNDVTVAWNCGDTGGSGFTAGACADSTISSEGRGLTASKSVSDLAGNSSATATSSPAVNVDKTAPITSGDAVSGWNNVDVTVTLAPSDGLSGVATTKFTIDGGAEQTYGAGNMPSLSTEGVHNLAFWSVDNAGNEERHQSVEINLDKTPPWISASQSPGANSNGWNNTDVTVSFECSDLVSGVASCSAGETVTTEGATQPVSGTASDNAGNSATATTSVSIDKTAPTITGSASPTANENGWNSAPVTVSFTCSDALSGVSSCSAPTTLSSEGSGQSATGNAADVAGNTTSTTVSDVNIDTTAPNLSAATSSSPNGNGWYGDDVTVVWSCGDALSGVAGGCPADTTVSGEGASLSASQTVSDRAGNSKSATVDGIRIDRTAPSTLATAPAPNGNGWYNAAVAVTLSANDNLSGVGSTAYAVDGGAVQTYSGPFSVGRGTHTVVFWSTDNAGNTEDSSVAGQSVTFRVDTVAPVVAVTGVSDGQTYQPGSYSAGCSTSDALSDVATPARLSVSGGPAGLVTLTCDGAVDRAGNSQNAPVKVTINVVSPSNFGGFQRPVEGNGTLNVVNAGSSVPVKFSLGGYRGMDIFVSGSPTSAPYACNEEAPADAAEPTASVGGHGLSYDAGSDTYKYVWKTDKSWMGCRVLQVNLSDGSSHRAYFRFRHSEFE